MKTELYDLGDVKGNTSFGKKSKLNLRKYYKDSIANKYLQNRNKIIDIIQVYKYPKARPYRLGDVVKGNTSFGKKSKLNLRKYYKDSIANKYLQNTNKINDFETLLEIIEDDNYKYYPKPGNNVLVVHLRVGDILIKKDIDKVLRNVGMGNNKSRSVWGDNLSYIDLDKLFARIPDEISSIAFVSGIHQKRHKSLSKSEEYINKIVDYTKAKGYDVSLRFNEDADTDFVYMSNAKYFMPSIGGFSALVSQMVKKKGGVVCN